MVTFTSWVILVLVLLDGRLTGNPEGIIEGDVNIKNINNKNTTSVSEEKLKVVSTLLRVLNSII
jgi:hypothetical protein